MTDALPMPFDLMSVALTRSETGSKFHLFHPGTRAPLLDEKGQPVTITLLGQYSKPFRDKLREIQLDRAKWHSRAADRARVMNEGKKPEEMVEPDPIPQQVLDEQDTAQLVACTVGWSIAMFKGRAFLFSEENARLLWEEPGLEYLREPALRFILTDGNFLSDGSKISSDSRDTSSAS